jgi:hypothetical protein
METSHLAQRCGIADAAADFQLHTGSASKLEGDTGKLEGEIRVVTSNRSTSKPQESPAKCSILQTVAINEAYTSGESKPEKSCAPPPGFAPAPGFSKSCRFVGERRKCCVWGHNVFFGCPHLLVQRPLCK